MTDHHDLTGKFAVHPFAYFQGTDPALDAANEVTAYKAWVDTSTGNTLKIRNAANTGWDTILAGGGGVGTAQVVRFPLSFNLSAFLNSGETITPTTINYV